MLQTLTSPSSPEAVSPAAARCSALMVGGVVPFSATDYPGRLAVVVFVQGCAWRCGYCHNPHLQTRTPAGNSAWEGVLRLLQRRIGLIDAVVFSGGEPCTDPALPGAIRAVKAMGFMAGLHTAGIYPRRLAEVLPLLDWVGLDIKSQLDHYPAVTGVTGSGEAAFDCAAQVLASGVASEFRTTLHPTLHTEAGLRLLAGTLRGMGLRHYALQECNPMACGADLRPVASAALREELAAMFDRFTYRPAAAWAA